jgi:transcriptional regulator with XRE-family HTH domain
MNLDELLTRIGWTPAELSTRLDVSPTTVAQWLRGRRHPPQAVLDWLGQLAECHARTGDAPAGWWDG